MIEYRHNVTTRIAHLVETLAGSDQALTDLMWLGCHHEEQHQELILTDLKHVLAKNPLKPAYQAR